MRAMRRSVERNGVLTLLLTIVLLFAIFAMLAALKKEGKGAGW
jgi:hypothetical protein